MAKVKGPLLSMDARGQLGKSLVFLGWKGIKTVRSHVTPANPRSAGQITQRGRMGNAVFQWHANYKLPADIAAFNLAASLEAKIMSGFNYFAKGFIAAYVAGKTPVAAHMFDVTSNTGGSLSFKATFLGDSGPKYQIGYSPTVLGSAIAMTQPAAGGEATATAPGLTAGQYVYIKFSLTDVDYPCTSGIYKVMLLA